MPKNIFRKHLNIALRDPGWEKVYKQIQYFCQLVQDAGGQAFLVGGAVRDLLLNIRTKDFDVEVFGILPNKIKEILDNSGYKYSEIGSAFSVLRVSPEDCYDLDISLPRTDSKTGPGHKGFEVKADPFMSAEDAAKRRDFTINSISEDPLTGEIFDFYDGITDLKSKILRITNQDSFKDDPLRILRGMQLVSRFDLSVDEDSVKIMRSMQSSLLELPKERILEEFNKLLLSQKPSKGLSLGMDLGVFDTLFPMFSALKNTPQDPVWHPEGDVWTHTLLSVDQAQIIIDQENFNCKQSLVILYSVLCHDLGKQSTTALKKGHITSYDHQKVGAKMAEDFLNNIGIESWIKNRVVKLVANHLAPSFLFDVEERGQLVTDGAIRRLAYRIQPATIEELILVREADCLGVDSNSISNQGECEKVGNWLKRRSKSLEVYSSYPKDIIDGKILISLGLSPGAEFGRIIELANKLRDDKNYNKEKIISIIDRKKNKEAIASLEQNLNQKN